jgi:hypothetical protein
VARDVDDVVDAAGDPIIAVSVAAGAVAGEVLAWMGGKIRVHERSARKSTGLRLCLRAGKSDNPAGVMLWS